MGQAQNRERQRHRHHGVPDRRGRLPDEVEAKVPFPQRSHPLMLSYGSDLGTRELGEGWYQAPEAGTRRQERHRVGAATRAWPSPPRARGSRVQKVTPSACPHGAFPPPQPCSLLPSLGTVLLAAPILYICLRAERLSDFDDAAPSGAGFARLVAIRIRPWRSSQGRDCA
jgi:hypothetical protein